MRRPASRLILLVLLCACLLPGGVAAQGRQLIFPGSGHTFHGDWTAEAVVFRDEWQPDQSIRYEVTLRLPDTHAASLAATGIKMDKWCVLVTAERTFDADGWMRLASDERMSTLLTPAGLAIEGGVQGALTTRYGYPFGSVIDQFVSVPAGAASSVDTPGLVQVVFSGMATLPVDLPPGLYRLRFDFGVMVGSKVYNLNGFGFAARTFSSEAGTCTYYYSSLIPASGTHVSGRVVDAAAIQPRFPWLILSGYNSNGYRGVVADEDRHRFAMSDRNLIPDEVILPMFDDNGNRLSYSLEPQFPADGIDANQNIAWDWTRGALAVKVTGPDGSVVDLGTANIVAKSGNGPTTKNAAFTTWRPQKYGRYAVTTTGWIADRTGRRFEGGGTYRFWIAKRMTLATATFQGQPYPVGASYGRDIQFNPALPADVTVTATLFVGSDPARARSLTYAGRATAAGLFGAAQGMKPFPLTEPGEYHAHVLATHTDADGHLWVSTMRHAGVVYPENSPVVARGKKIAIAGKYVDRGNTAFEGHVHEDGAQHLAHITFPYLAGDVIVIAAEGQGANKIEPVLTYQMAGDTAAWDTKLNGVGTTNLSIKSSTKYSPHMFPEFITDLEYYYGAAPRPGFMGRFIIGESITRAPYWAVSPNSFGGQIGASPNGDAPGDIYRLLGGVVLRRAGRDPMYAGYMASAFLLPRGSEANRIVAPGSEDLIGSTGERARFFLVGLRPGTAFELGSTFRPALQIDPMVPASITFTVDYPNGRQVTATGTGDRFGSFAGPAPWPLDVPGVYRYRISATWNGYQGRMPGLPEDGGYFFVYGRTKPAGAAGLRIDGTPHRTFTAAAGATIAGTSSASKVFYTLLTPGAVIDQGEIPVNGGRFQYRFDPVAANARVPIYDIVSVTTGKMQLGRVIHLTFFAEERAPDGTPFFDVMRVILRGTTLLAARPAAPAPMADLGAVVTSAAGDAIDEVRGTLDLRSGANQVRATDPAAIRAWDARIDRLLRDGGLAVTRRDADTLVAGRVHERLQQYHDGVPVAGATLTRQLDRGLTVSVFGTYHAAVDAAVVPTIGAAGARRAAAAHAGATPAGVGQPALAILPREEGGYALAWMTETRTAGDIRLCAVDAGTGAILRDHSLVRRQQSAYAPASGSGEATPMHAVWTGSAFSAVDRTRPATITTYDLRGNRARTSGLVAGTMPLTAADVAVSASAAWADRVVVDAHGHAGAAYDFFLSAFGRRGFDHADAPVAVVVHPGGEADGTGPFDGAAWTGREIVLGDGSAGARPWAAAYDTVVHEFAHAILDHAAGTPHGPDARALAEAFADICATAAEFAAQPAGAGPRLADYLIGEDAAAGGLRSLADPRASGHLDQAGSEPARSDAPHAGSTIASHAYYLAVEGGRHAGSGIAVAGVGAARRRDIEQVIYRAWVYLLPAESTFTMARAATRQSARDLFGEGSDAERALEEAWTAVGVR